MSEDMWYFLLHKCIWHPRLMMYCCSTPPAACKILFFLCTDYSSNTDCWWHGTIKSLLCTITVRSVYYKLLIWSCHSRGSRQFCLQVNSIVTLTHMQSSWHLPAEHIKQHETNEFLPSLFWRELSSCKLWSVSFSPSGWIWPHKQLRAEIKRHARTYTLKFQCLAKICGLFRLQDTDAPLCLSTAV